MDFPSGRRTVHDYRPEPVDAAVLDRALEAAQEAPCHKLTWPWRFTRVGPEGRKQLCALNVRLKGEKRPMTEAFEARITAKMMNPAELLIVSQVRSADPFRAKEDYAAVACAIQNLSLSLHADGVGSKWSSGAVTRHEEAYRVAGIDPELEEIVGFVWIGHPAVVPAAPGRPPLEQVVRRVP
jgi:nitroreductase